MFCDPRVTLDEHYPHRGLIASSTTDNTMSDNNNATTATSYDSSCLQVNSKDFFFLKGFSLTKRPYIFITRCHSLTARVLFSFHSITSCKYCTPLQRGFLFFYLIYFTWEISWLSNKSRDLPAFTLNLWRWLRWGIWGHVPNIAYFVTQCHKIRNWCVNSQKLNRGRLAYHNRLLRVPKWTTLMVWHFVEGYPTVWLFLY